MERLAARPRLWRNRPMTEPTLTDVQACVFEAYGTLFDLATPLLRRTAALDGDAVRLIGIWREKQQEYCWLRSLMGRHVDYWHVTGQALDYAMALLEIDDPGLRADLIQAYLVLSPYPETAQVLARVKESGRRTALLSDASLTMLTAAVNRAVVHGALDTILSVDERGVFKPHPSAYQLAVEKLGIGAAHVCYVTADGWDAAGAAAFGFQVVWVNRDGRPREQLAVGPAATVASLDELPATLGL